MNRIISRILAAALAFLPGAAFAYTPVVTPSGESLPYKLVDGVKEFRLVVEEIDWEIAKCWISPHRSLCCLSVLLDLLGHEKGRLTRLFGEESSEGRLRRCEHPILGTVAPHGRVRET